MIVTTISSIREGMNSSQDMLLDNDDSHKELGKLELVVLSEFLVPSDAYMGNQEIQEVICQEGVGQIGERAFKRCSSLQKLSLPSTLEIIGKNAFSLCTSLVSVSLLEANDGQGGGLKQIAYGSFFGCCLLSRVNIPSSVETIEDCAFEGCTSLTELDLQDAKRLVSIGERAFEGCEHLQQVRIPAAVETIQTRAFAKCTLLVELRLQEGLKTIMGRAMEGNTSLERIQIPSTVSVLHYSLFGQCSSLVDVTLQEGLTTIGSHVFKTCSSLRRIHIPSTVETIGHSCFARCTSLQNVLLSSHLTFLGDCAFACCRALCAIFLPRSLAVIGESVFDGCNNLVTIEFESRMDAQIGEFAFCDCAALTNIAIPWQISRFHPCLNDRFDGCDRLHNVYGTNKIATATADRFKQFPVHEKCYRASVTTPKELQDEIECCQSHNTKPRHSQSFADDFGMTPFHLLFSSATRRMDLLRVLLENYPSYMLGRKDRFGKRATDYLLGFDWTGDTRSLIRLALSAWTMDRLEVWGHEVWREESSRRLDELLNEPNQGRREKLLRNNSVAMERYERFEAASLLELWLWKMMMNSAALHQVKSDVSDRSGYRIQCGASFVVPVVLGWLE